MEGFVQWICFASNQTKLSRKLKYKDCLALIAPVPNSLLEEKDDGLVGLSARSTIIICHHKYKYKCNYNHFGMPQIDSVKILLRLLYYSSIKRNKQPLIFH